MIQLNLKFKKSIVLITCVLIFIITMLIVSAADNQSNDLDKDGVIDNEDKCPETLANAIIVEPTDNYDYSGCSCAQIKEQIDEESVCIDFFCHERILEIKYLTHWGKFQDCEKDVCINHTYYDYPTDGYAKCVDGKPQEKTCEPTITENSIFCGYKNNEITNETKDYDEKPELKETVNKILLTNSELKYEAPEKITEDTKIRSIMTFEKGERKAVTLKLLNEDGLIIKEEEAYCGEDENEELFCTSLWEIKADKKGEKKLSFDLTYDDGLGEEINEKIPLTIMVDIDFKPPETKNNLIERKDTKFLEEIIEEINTLDKIEEMKIEETLDKMKIAEENLKIVKNKKIENGKTFFQLTLESKPRITVNDVTIIEYVPKEIAEHIEEIKFTIQPTIIINEDPMMMWHFSTVDERVDLTYSVSKEITKNTKTIVTAEKVEKKKMPWHIIIPMIIIPMILLSMIIRSKKTI